jgi:hypothetical protein
MLCDKCRNIDFTASALVPNSAPQHYFGEGDDEEGPEYYAYPHHPSLETLFDVSSADCHLCRQIRQELFHIRGHESTEPHHHGPIEMRHYIKADKTKTSYPKGLQAVVRTPMRDVKVSFDLVQYPCGSKTSIEKTYTDLRVAFLAGLLEEKANTKELSIGCQENFKLANTWLHKCLKAHSLCTISTLPSPPLPSRILDVECETSSSFLSLRSSEGCHGPYVSLSHVWGHTQIITTTLATLDERMKCISMDDLSHTFRDAVILARQMSIRYVWIDSLCIIQDSADDWRTESSKMGEYYMNALFNIAAVSSFDGSEGCFMTRDVLPLTPIPISIRFPDGTPKATSEIFIRPSIGWDPVHETVGFQRPPLWRRAWVVQERLLSPRILQFSSMQMSWRCRVAEASERVPEMCKISEGSGGDKLFQETLFGLKKFNAQSEVCPSLQSVDSNITFGTSAELLDLYNAWYDLVTLYGKCFLTQPSDIFPAISGIARAIALSINDRYISGLWRHDLHRGLLWSVPDSTLSKPDLRNIRAPSWSWAAMNGTCNFYVRQISQKGVDVKTNMFAIEGVGERTSGIDTFGGFGSMEEVVLGVSGRLKQAHPSDSENDGVFHGIQRRSETLFDLAKRKSVGFYFADNADRRYLTEVWCVPVMTEQRTGYMAQKNEERALRPVEARCLALLRLCEDRNIYMRVGSAWITDYSWFDAAERSSFYIV